MISRHDLHAGDGQGKEEGRGQRGQLRHGKTTMGRRLWLKHHQDPAKAHEAGPDAEQAQLLTQHKGGERHQPKGTGKGQGIGLGQRQLLHRIEAQDHGHDTGG